MSSNHITVEFVSDMEPDSLVRLYQDAGWWESGDTPEKVASIVASSFCFAVAIADGEVVGMGRAISDGCSDAYIQDVAVLKERRGQGIGSEIINHIVNHLKKNGISWIGLVGEPGTGYFYRKLGFRTMENYIPMKLLNN